MECVENKQMNKLFSSGRCTLQQYFISIFENKQSYQILYKCFNIKNIILNIKKIIWTIYFALLINHHEFELLQKKEKDFQIYRCNVLTLNLE